MLPELIDRLTPHGTVQGSPLEQALDMLGGQHGQIGVRSSPASLGSC